jgi:hypothetical protein
MVYVGMARESADERGFDAIRRLRLKGEHAKQMTLEHFKALVREQYFMLLIDRQAAVAAIPGLLPEDAETRAGLLKLLEEILTARGELTGEAAERFEEVRGLFAPTVPEGTSAPGKLVVAARRKV